MKWTRPPCVPFSILPPASPPKSSQRYCEGQQRQGLEEGRPLPSAQDVGWRRCSSKKRREPRTVTTKWGMTKVTGLRQTLLAAATAKVMQKWRRLVRLPRWSEGAGSWRASSQPWKYECSGNERPIHQETYWSSLAREKTKRTGGKTTKVQKKMKKMKKAEAKKKWLQKLEGKKLKRAMAKVRQILRLSKERTRL